MLKEINKSKNHRGSKKNIIICKNNDNMQSKVNQLIFFASWPVGPTSIRAVGEAMILDFLSPKYVRVG